MVYCPSHIVWLEVILQKIVSDDIAPCSGLSPMANAITNMPAPVTANVVCTQNRPHTQMHKHDVIWLLKKYMLYLLWFTKMSVKIGSHPLTALQ